MDMRNLGILVGVVFLITLFASGCGAKKSHVCRIISDPPLADPVYQKPGIDMARPSALEFWINTPTRHGYPWNIIRIWFPEAAVIHDSNGKQIFHLHCSDDPATWTWVREDDQAFIRAECEIPGGGRYIRLAGKDDIDQDMLHLTMTFENNSDQDWINVSGGCCLQSSAAGDYEDNTGERTYWILDDAPVLTCEMAITDPGMRGMTRGNTIPMKAGGTKQITERVAFIASKDGRYVLGYSWQPSGAQWYNRAPIVACNHVEPMFGDIKAGRTKTAKGILFVHEGSVEQAFQRFLDWKNGL